MLTPIAAFSGLRPRDKLALLTELSRHAGTALRRDPGAIAAAVLAREALGTTGFGAGLAIPHARLPDLPAPAGFLARLSRPIDFAAIDGQPVDLVYLLLSPAGDDGAHLATLAAITRRLRDAAALAALRAAPSPAALLAAFQ
jgi:PTS system nitrogen regulatory IIA component